MGFERFAIVVGAAKTRQGARPPAIINQLLHPRPVLTAVIDSAAESPVKGIVAASLLVNKCCILSTVAAPAVCILVTRGDSHEASYSYSYCRSTVAILPFASPPVRQSCSDNDMPFKEVILLAVAFN